MRRVRLVSLAVGAALLMLSSVGCSTSDTGSSRVADDGRPLVVATFTVLADMARNVGGPLIRVESLTKPGAEIHGYEPTPSDLRAADGAALVVSNGMGLDDWFHQFLTSDAEHVVASNGVPELPIVGGEYDGHANPHAWMSPTSGAVYVDNIARALGRIDPANGSYYKSNARNYQHRLTSLNHSFREAIQRLPASQRVLVTCEGAFVHLARSVGLEDASLWPVNAEKQSTPQRVASVIDLVAEREIPAVFCESTVSDESQQVVAAETGATLAGPLYVDSLSEDNGPVPTYLDLLKHDVNVITTGLTS